MCYLVCPIPHQKLRILFKQLRQGQTFSIYLELDVQFEDRATTKKNMKLTATLTVSVAFLASAAMAQTEPPICDPAETLPTGEQGIGPFGETIVKFCTMGQLHAS